MKEGPILESGQSRATITANGGTVSEHSFRVWEPEARQEYRPLRGPASPEQIEAAQQEFAAETIRYWAAYAKTEPGEDRYARVAKLGACMGKAFIQLCQVQGPSQPSFDEVYRLFGEKHKKRAQTFISGFLSEYGITQALASSRTFEVYLPNDDLTKGEHEESEGVDLWVNLGNGADDRELPDEDIALAIQIKAVSLRADLSLPQHVFLLRSDDDIEHLMSSVITDKNLVMNDPAYYEKVRYSLYGLLDTAHTYSNGLAAVVLVSAPGSDAHKEAPDINRRTGEVNPDLQQKLLADLEAIKDFYLEVNLVKDDEAEDQAEAA